MSLTLCCVPMASKGFCRLFSCHFTCVLPSHVCVVVAEVPRLGNTTSAVPPNMNKLPVVGQTPFDAKGSAPQDTPTPLVPLDDQKPPIPLQVYQSDRAFFGSAPVGGLEILTSKFLLHILLQLHSFTNL